MMFRVGIIIAIFCCAASTAFAQGVPEAEALDKDIREVCTQPATAGQHWAVTGSANGDFHLEFKKHPENHSLNINREQWSGVQEVLKKDQASDNKDYRRCVLGLASIFRSIFPTVVKSQLEIDRQIKGFLFSKQLALLGYKYDDASLASQFSVTPMQWPMALSNSVLTGSFRALSNDNSSPLGLFRRAFLERNGVIVAVMINIGCNTNTTNVCLRNYEDWKSSIEDIEGLMKQSRTSLGGGPAGSPFAAKGVLTDYVAYDGNWRVSVSRVDMDGSSGPNVVMILVASNSQ